MQGKYGGKHERNREDAEVHRADENGQTYPEYLCTRDGFSLLVMGFTGKEALEWKLKYINAFNQMEAFIQERKSSEWLVTRKHGKLIRRAETDTLANLVEYAEAQGSRNMRQKVYILYSRLVNSLVGIQSGERETAPFKTISVIAFLEDMILHTFSCASLGPIRAYLLYRTAKSRDVTASVRPTSSATQPGPREAPRLPGRPLSPRR